ncbi:hypothetical protein FHT39_000352 [Mitsuaria sp. BK045]|uniref:hypothetical protein n=1 Tax=unclassified Roseateles TaxID=2626991 RepID=UPI0016085473|nr:MULTISPECIES: hypothetical protein [unclassified Roseateles]MBB3291713.1 hypothetical protein [Mitsuaria sp. BK041]MBB3360930.1 hypothetical protein [Mitsuaria sp. BK045]
MKKSRRWRNGATVRSALSKLASQRRHFDTAGKQVITACAGSIFPADVYFMATCNRALQNFDAFQLTMKADFFSTSMILLRVQLDSVLRCYGLLQTTDPHDVATQVMNEVKLSKIKDKHGKPMTDAYLVDLFSSISDANKAIKHVYSLSSGYVHLSNAAIGNLLSKAKPTDAGQHGFYIGAGEPEVPTKAKLELVQAFNAVTNVIFQIAAEWAKTRGTFGNDDDLIAKYGPKA